MKTELSESFDTVTQTQSQAWDYPIITWMVVVHLLAAVALWFFSWSGFFLFLGMNFLTGCLGVTFCYHRLLTHRSFKAHPVVENITAFLGTLALQGPLQEWVAQHRLHHQMSDTHGDPHDSSKGFWYSHMEWMLIQQPKIKDQKWIDKMTKDISQNPFLIWLSKPMVMISLQVLVGVIFLLVGGLSWMLWGIFFRLAFGYHVTWLVNSATHRWGYRTFESPDRARNNWVVGLLAWGEGWHNNHHRFANVCSAGFRWWEFDITYGIIRIFHKFRLVKDLRHYPKQAFTRTG